MPTAQGAVAAYPDMMLLTFDEGNGFEVDEGEINIGISMRKGNTELKQKLDEVLSPMTEQDFNDLMAQAIYSRALRPRPKRNISRKGNRYGKIASAWQ